MSSASDLAVRVRGLSKAYTIAHQGERPVTLAESLLARARRPFARTPTETFWALKDVEFDIQKGDVVGIIGRNGAGKSTLLKVLSRITEPTAGQVDLYGRVGSLLEVGTGFHPELSGRENVFLNGAILGMTKAEIRRQFDAIVDFAGVEQFLDTPVKRYSSGMYVRLAFAVAAHLNPEILIVDEVLAVGDAEFQKKCLGKLRDVSRDGRTVLLVSHHLETVTRLCTSAILMKSGQLLTHGPVPDVMSIYAEQTAAVQEGSRTGWQASLDIDVRVELPVGNSFAPSAAKVFRFEARTFRDPNQPWFLSGHIRNSKGEAIAHFDSRLIDKWFVNQPAISIDIELRHPWFAPGNYTLDAYVCVEGRVLCERVNAVQFRVTPELPYPGVTDPGAVRHAPVLSDFSMTVSEPTITGCLTEVGG